MGPPTSATRDAGRATGAASSRASSRPDPPRAQWALHSGTASATGSEPSPPRRVATAEHVEWASPTSIRARSRPSNLHAYLRSSASFPLASAASPLRRGAGGGSVSSGGSTGATSPRRTRSQRVRSQSTRATQTSTADFLIHSGGTSEDAAASVALGVYGDVARMDMATVDFLIAALEERRRDLVQDDAAPHRSSDASSDSEPQAKARPSGRNGGGGVFSNAGDRSDPAKGQPSVVEGDDGSSRGGGRRVRSRSYEALAKLEQILEARHQQLIMHDGALDGPVALPLQEPPGSDLTEEIRKLQQSFLMEARSQR